MAPADQCDPIASTDILWQVAYENACESPYATPITLADFSFDGLPDVAITVAGAPTFAQLGSSASFTVTASATDAAQLANPVTITIEAVAGMSGIVTTPPTVGVVSGSLAGGDLSWTVDPTQLPASIVFTGTVVGQGVCPGSSTVTLTNARIVGNATAFPGTSDETLCPVEQTASGSIQVVSNADDATDESNFNFRLASSPPGGRSGWLTGLQDDGDGVRETVNGEGEFIPWLADFPIGAGTGALWSNATFVHSLSTIDQQLITAGSDAMTWEVVDTDGTTTINGSVSAGDITAVAATSITVDLAFLAAEVTTAGWANPTSMDGREVRLRYSTVIGDQATATTTYNQLGTLTITSVAVSNCGDGTTAEFAVPESTTLVRGEVTASLSLPDVMDACETLTRTLTITNPTEVDVSNASVVLNASSDWEVVGGSFTANPGSEATFSAATDTITAGTLSAGETITIDLQVRLPLGYSSTNLQFDRSWDSLQTAITVADDDYTAVTTVAPVLVREASILTQVTPSKQTVDGRSWSWTVYLTNAGSGTAVGMRLLDDPPDQLTAISLTSVTKEAVDGSTSDISGSVATSNPADNQLQIDVDTSVTLAPGETIIAVVTGTLDAASPDGVSDLATHTLSGTWGCDGVFDTASTANQTYRSTLSRLDYAVGATDSITNLATATTIDVCDSFFVYPVLRNSGQASLYETEWTFTLPTGFTFQSGVPVAFRTATGDAFVGDASVVAVGQTITVTGSASAPAGSLALALAELVPVGSSSGASLIQIRVPVESLETSPASADITTEADPETPMAGDDIAAINRTFAVTVRRPAVALAVSLANVTAGTDASTTTTGGHADVFDLQLSITNSGSAAAEEVVLLEDLLTQAAAWPNVSTATITGPTESGTPLYSGETVSSIRNGDGHIPAQDLPSGTTHTYVIRLGAINGLAPINCADVTVAGSVSWGCNGVAFDETDLEATANATIDLSPDADSNVTVTHVQTQEVGGRLGVTLTLSNTGGVLTNPVLTYQVPGGDLVFDSTRATSITSGPAGLTIASVVDTPDAGGTDRTITLSGTLRAGQTVVLDLGLYPTTEDTTADQDTNPEGASLDPSAPTVVATLDVSYADTCGGTENLTQQTPTLDPASPDLDITDLDPSTRIVREGQKVQLDVLVVNDGDNGSTVDDPMFTFDNVGDGWASAQYRLTTRGATGPEVVGSWQTVVEGAGIALGDLAKWTGGSASSPTRNYVRVTFRGTVTRAGSLQVNGSVNATAKRHDGTDAGIGNQHLDRYRQIVLGFDLTKIVTASTEAESSDTDPRTAWIGERLTYRIDADWFGAQDLTGSDIDITNVVLTDSYPSDAVVVDSNAADSDASNTLTWNIGTISGTGTVSRTITLRVDRDLASASADGDRFRNQASASFDFQGASFAPGVEGYPSGSQRRVDHTLREPVLAQDVLLGLASTGPFSASVDADGGDRVFAQLTLDNTSGTAPLYDSQYTLSLPTGVSFVAVAVAPSQGSVSPSGGDVIWSGVDAIAAGSSITVVIELLLDAGVTIGDELSVDVAVRGDSLAENSVQPDGAEPARLYTASETAAATVRVQSLSLAGGITATSVASTSETSASADMVIGEQATIAYDVVVPVGEASDLQIAITIPQGLEVLAEPTVVIGSGLSGAVVPTWTLDGGAASYPAQATTSDRFLRMDLGVGATIAATGTTDAQRTLSVTYTCRVLNNATVGTAGGETATMVPAIAALADGATNQDQADVTLTVVEPSLAIAITARNETAGDAADYSTLTAPDGGDQIDIRLRVEAASGAAFATASDLRVALDLADLSEWTYQSVVSADIDGSSITAGGFEPERVGTTLSWGRDVGGNPTINLAAGEILTVVVRVQLDAALQPATTLAADAQVDWTSVPGLDSAERDGSGTANDYLATDNQSVTSANTATLVSALTGPSNARVGEAIVWTLTVDDLPEGLLPNLVVTQTLPEHIQLDGVPVVTTSGDVTVSLVTQPSGSETNTTLTWDFGDLSVPADNTGDDQIVITVTGFALTSIPDAAALDMAANARLVFDDDAGAQQQRDAALDLRVVQPLPEVQSKVVLSPAGQVPLGGTIQWRVRALNGGQGDAYQIQVLDILPPEADNAGVTTLTVRLDGDVVMASSIITADAGGDIVTITLPAGTAWGPGELLEVDLTVTVDSDGDAVAGDTIINRARIAAVQTLPVSAAAATRAKTLSQSALVSAAAVLVDNIPPDAPVITSISDDTGRSGSDGITNDSTLVIAGTATPDVNEPVTIRVFRDGSVIGTTTTTAAAGWAWSLDTTAVSLADGPYVFTAEAEDVSANISSRSGDYPVVVDSVRPSVAVADTAQLTNDSTPTLTGTVSDDRSGVDRLRVLIGGTSYELGDGFLSLDGGTGPGWTLDTDGTSPGFSDGQYQVSLVAVDVAGNIIISLSQTITIDTTPPAIPTVTSQLTALSQPTLAGTIATDTARLTVTVDGTTYASDTDPALTIDASAGTWQLDLSTTGQSLTDGVYDVGATAFDAAGNSAADITSDELEVDLTSPVAATVTRLSTNAAEPTLAGTSEAGTTLVVRVNGVDYTSGVSSVLSLNTDGTWSLDLTGAGPGDGAYAIRLTSQDSAGNTTQITTADGLVIDTLGRLDAVTGFAAIDRALVTNRTTAPLLGSAGASESLKVDVGGQTIASTATAGGDWSVTTAALADGSYTIRVTDSDGDRTEWVGGLVIDTTGGFDEPSGFPSFDGPKLTNDATPTLDGTGPSSASVTVTVDAQTPAPTTSASGDWTTVLTSLADGSYTVTVDDGVGFVLLLDAGLIIDTDGTLEARTGFSTLSVPGTTNDDTPLFSGVYDTGPVRVAVDNGTPLKVPVTMAGNWAAVWFPALAEGTYEVDVTTSEGFITERVDDLVIDTTAPAVPTVVQQITNNAQPLITGASEAGTTLTIEVNGTTFTQGVSAGFIVDEDTGAWSLDLSSAGLSLPENRYDVDVTSTDTAGNSSTNRLPFGATGPTVTNRSDLLVDLTDPNGFGGTTLPEPQITNNSGPIIEGFATDDLSGVLTFTVTITESFGGMADVVSVSLGDDGLTYDTATGDWELDVSVPTSDGLDAGTYDISITVEDVAGNTSSFTNPQKLVVDLDVPTVTVNDLLTNNASPTITGTADDPTGIAALSVRVSGPNRSTIVDQTFVLSDTALSYNATTEIWSLDLAAASVVLPDGVYEVTATAEDAAGNEGTDVTTNELTIDTTAPVVTAVDLITNDTTPVLSGTLDDASATLSVTVNGTTYTVGDGFLSLVGGVGPTWLLDLNGLTTPLTEGVYTVTAVARDAASNTDTATATLTIDLTDPALPTVVSQRTRNQSPTVTGTTEVGTTLVVFVAGTLYTTSSDALSVPGDGSWSLDLATAGVTLPEAVYSVFARATDAAGNRSLDATSQELTIDLTPPIAPTVNRLTTSNTRPTLTGTTSADADSTLTVTVNGTTVNEGAALLIDGSDWQLDLSLVSGFMPLADGTYEVLAEACDAVGNCSQDSTTDELIIDTSAPVAPTVTSLTTNDTTPSLSGTYEAGTALTVTVDGLSYTLGTDSELSVDGSQWTLDLSAKAPVFADGRYDVVAVSTDAAGNSTSDATTDELHIDTAAPLVGVTRLSTNDTTPVLTGTASDSASSIVSLVVTVDGTTYTWPGSSSLTYVASSGTWRLTIPDADVLAEGVYDVAATVVDSAGNSADDPTADELVIDTTAPTVTVDRQFTNDTTPVISGTIDSSAVALTVSVDGATYRNTDTELTINGDGTWTLDLSTAAPIAEGVYDVVATAVDSTLNVGTDGTTNELVIDTTAPVAPTVDVLITNDTTPTLTGTAAAAAQLSVTVDGITYVFGTDPELSRDGTAWSLDLSSKSPAFSDGLYDVNAVSTDVGGSSFDVTVDELQIDTQPPVIEVVSQVTNDTTPIVTGSVRDDDSTIASLSISIDGTAYLWPSGSAVSYVPSTNTWSLDVSVIGALSEGTYEIVAVANDAAGNSGSDATTSELIIDLTAPAVTVDRLVTNDTTPILTGTVDDPTVSLSIIVNGITYQDSDDELSIDGDGIWTLDLSAAPALSDGSYDVAATATDSAGNAGSDETVDELEIDTVDPVVTVVDQVTGNPSPLLTGTVSERPATFTVTVDGQTYANGVDAGLVVANGGDGPGWSLDLAVAGQVVLPGNYTVTAAATDDAANAASATGTLVIDASPPQVDGDGGLRVLIRGRVSPNVTRVEVNGVVVRPDAAGAYSIEVVVPFVPITIPVSIFDSTGRSESGSLRIAATLGGDT